MFLRLVVLDRDLVVESNPLATGAPRVATVGDLGGGFVGGVALGSDRAHQLELAIEHLGRAERGELAGRLLIHAAKIGVDELVGDVLRPGLVGATEDPERHHERRDRRAGAQVPGQSGSMLHIERRDRTKGSSADAMAGLVLASGPWGRSPQQLSKRSTAWARSSKSVSPAGSATRTAR